jgi:hypothetical protein
MALRRIAQEFMDEYYSIRFALTETKILCVDTPYAFHITLLQMLHLTQRLIFSEFVSYAYYGTPHVTSDTYTLHKDE